MLIDSMCFFLQLCLLKNTQQGHMSVNTLSNSSRKALVSCLKILSHEFEVLSRQVESLENLPQLEAKLADYPDLIKVLKNAAWHIQEGAFERAFDYLGEIHILVAQEKLDDLSV